MSTFETGMYRVDFKDKFAIVILDLDKLPRVHRALLRSKLAVSFMALLLDDGDIAPTTPTNVTATYPQLVDFLASKGITVV